MKIERAPTGFRQVNIAIETQEEFDRIYEILSYYYAENDGPVEHFANNVMVLLLASQK